MVVEETTKRRRKKVIRKTKGRRKRLSIFKTNHYYIELNINVLGLVIKAKKMIQGPKGGEK